MKRANLMTMLLVTGLFVLVAAPFETIAGGMEWPPPWNQKGVTDFRKAATPARMAKSPAEPVFATTARLSQIVGADVQSPQGDALGKIADLVVDPHGRVTYLIIARDGMMQGGGMGMDDKLVAVPIAAADAKSAVPGRYIIAVDKHTLAGAPGFSAQAWPDLGDRSWQDEVRGYFRGEARQ